MITNFNFFKFSWNIENFLEWSIIREKRIFNPMEKIAYLSDRLKSELENKGLSAADLCRLTGIDTSIMSKYIRGIKHPKIERLRRIAAVLYVTPEWLEGYDVPKTPAPVQLSPLENDIIINFRACNDAEKFAIIEFVKKIRG